MRRTHNLDDRCDEYEGATGIVPSLQNSKPRQITGARLGSSGLNELQLLLQNGRGKNHRTQILRKIRLMLEQVSRQSGGEIDAMIRNIAIENRCTVHHQRQMRLAGSAAKGLDVIYLKPQVTDLSRWAFERLHEHTIAVYLKNGSPRPRGTINDMKLVRFRDQPPMIMNSGSRRRSSNGKTDGFIEIEKRGITVVQIGSVRRSPAGCFRWHGDHRHGRDAGQLREVQRNGLSPTGRGLIIAVFRRRCSPIVNVPSDAGYVVKTMEAPRELQVPDQITQYTTLAACPILLRRRTSSSSMNCGRTRISQSLPTLRSCRRRHGRGHPRQQCAGRAPALLRPRGLFRPRPDYQHHRLP